MVSRRTHTTYQGGDDRVVGDDVRLHPPTTHLFQEIHAPAPPSRALGERHQTGEDDDVRLESFLEKLGEDDFGGLRGGIRVQRGVVGR